MSYKIRMVCLMSVFMASFSLISAGEEGSCPVINDILSKRDSRFFSTNLVSAIETITLLEGASPVGSYGFASQPFPGDVDVFESVEVKKSFKEAKAYFSQRLASVAQRIATDTEIFLSDFKAGFDDEMAIDIGKSQGGGTFSGYDANLVKQKIQEKKDKNYLDEKEYQELLDLAKDAPTFAEWSKLKSAVHELTTLRWSLDELLVQKKLLRGGRSILLEDAIVGTLVKIDVLAPVTKSGGYTEVTNFYNLLYNDGEKTRNLTTELEDYASSMTKDVLEFYGKGKYLKATKRLWVLATIKKDNMLIAKTLPLLQSDAAALNQIIAESEVVRKILEPGQNITCFPVGLKLTKQIISFEKRSLIHSPDLSVGEMSNPQTGYIRPIFDALIKNCPKGAVGLDNILISEDNKALAVNNLEMLEERLHDLVNIKAKEFIDKIGIDPNNPLASLKPNFNVCPLVP